MRLLFSFFFCVMGFCVCYILCELDFVFLYHFLLYTSGGGFFTSFMTVRPDLVSFTWLIPPFPPVAVS